MLSSRNALFRKIVKAWFHDLKNWTEVVEIAQNTRLLKHLGLARLCKLQYLCSDIYLSFLKLIPLKSTKFCIFSKTRIIFWISFIYKKNHRVLYWCKQYCLLLIERKIKIWKNLQTHCFTDFMVLETFPYWKLHSKKWSELNNNKSKQGKNFLVQITTDKLEGWSADEINVSRLCSLSANVPSAPKRATFIKKAKS